MESSNRDKPVIRRSWTHKFLNKKYWHPQNPRNLERKWLAEQQQIQEKFRNEKAAEELKQERKQLQTAIQQLDEKDKDLHLKKRSVAFIYKKPPGFVDTDLKNNSEIVLPHDQNQKEVKLNNDRFNSNIDQKRQSAMVPLLDGCVWSSKRFAGNNCQIRGGFSPNDPNQQYLFSDDDEDDKNYNPQSTQQIQQQNNRKRKKYKGNLNQLSNSDRSKLARIVKREIKKRRRQKQDGQATALDAQSSSA
eukprot:TRINITY_DN4023_c0_g1_i4.p1 TRINITY_DN4023_c0_g1~~TRINITY_DN4023_c0_g1_i4.p1  ORF type:complete len:274 (-),score=39.87 TRINITY_DN4023_c0_g1_i4:143-883(-)